MVKTKNNKIKKKQVTPKKKKGRGTRRVVAGIIPRGVVMDRFERKWIGMRGFSPLLFFFAVVVVLQFSPEAGQLSLSKKEKL